MDRASGVLLAIFSLPSKYGIGTLGDEAYKFVDLLSEASQKYWQVLPITHTSFGNSPYSSISTFAGNPYFIDLDELAKEGFLKEEEYINVDFGYDKNRIDYNKLALNKIPILKKAAERVFKKSKDEVQNFINEHSYFITDYAVFCALKDKYLLKSFNEWPDEFKFKNQDAIDRFIKENKKEIEFYQILQFIFYKQWFKLKKYANEKGIKIIGDMPIYTAYDSCDVWASPEYYQLDENLSPQFVAGCPPDSFSAEGQLWGNPLYNYKYIEDNNFNFFIDKFSHLSNLYDVIRIDHFRGFDSYYCIPYGRTDAKIGEWQIGPGIKLFDAVKAALPNAEFIAEDLGFLTDSVHKLLKDTNFPGMKVLEFGFNHYDKDNTMYLPHTYDENTVAYLGTHDNDTFIGWLNSISKEDADYAIEYLKLNNPAAYHLDAMWVLYNSKSFLTIVMPQDLLGKGSSARINTPSTVSDSNWSYRFLESDLDENMVYLLKKLTVESGRG